MKYYSEMVESEEFKKLVLVQNERPELDILTITGFMAAYPDWRNRIKDHLACYSSVCES